MKSTISRIEAYLGLAAILVPAVLGVWKYTDSLSSRLNRLEIWQEQLCNIRTELKGDVTENYSIIKSNVKAWETEITDLKAEMDQISNSLRSAELEAARSRNESVTFSETRFQTLWTEVDSVNARINTLGLLVTNICNELELVDSLIIDVILDEPDTLVIMKPAEKKKRSRWIRWLPGV